MLEKISMRWPTLPVLVADGDYFLLSQGSLENWKERLLTGVSGELVVAALERLSAEAPDYWCRFFAMNLFAHLLADNPGYNGGKIWRDRKQALEDLKRLTKRTRFDIAVGDKPRGMHSIKVASSPSADLPSPSPDETPPQITDRAWGYLFDLPRPDSVNHEDPLMVLFATRMLEGWRKANERQEISFKDYLAKLLAKDFRELEWPRETDGADRPPDPDVMYRNWVAYSLRAAAKQIGDTAIAVVEAAIGMEVPEDVRRTLQYRYGQHPIAGGTSLAFAAKLLKSDASLHDGAADFLNGLINETEASPIVVQLNAKMGEYAVLGIDQHEQEAAIRHRENPVVVADEVGFEAAEARPDPDLETEQQKALKEFIAALPDTDRIIALGYLKGLRPAEIAKEHPSLGMDNKQIADRWVKIKRDLRARLEKYDGI